MRVWAGGRSHQPRRPAEVAAVGGAAGFFHPFWYKTAGVSPGQQPYVTRSALASRREGRSGAREASLPAGQLLVPRVSCAEGPARTSRPGTGLKGGTRPACLGDSALSRSSTPSSAREKTVRSVGWLGRDRLPFPILALTATAFSVRSVCQGKAEKLFHPPERKAALAHGLI